MFDNVKSFFKARGKILKDNNKNKQSFVNVEDRK